MYNVISELLTRFFRGNWFLDSGSLLGVIRDRKFLDSDKGIDISVIIDDYNDSRLEEFSKNLSNIGFIVSKYRWKGVTYKYCFVPSKKVNFYYAIDLHCFKKLGEDYCCPQVSLKMLNPIEKVFVSLKKGNPINENCGIIKRKSLLMVKFFYRDIFRYFGKAMNMDIYYSKGLGNLYLWYIPANLYQGTKVGMYGMNVLYNASDYLHFRYGDWETPVSDWNTIRDDGGIRCATEKEITSLLGL